MVTDRGGMGNNVVDIFMGDVETCKQFGRKFDVNIRVVTPEAEEADPPEDVSVRGEE